MAKYVAISILAPGVENFRQAKEMFGRQGASPGTGAIYAGFDGKTFITVIERDGTDLASTATYAPFFESTTVIPVVDVDSAWVSAMETALTNLDQ